MNPEGENPGEPIRILAEQEYEASADFIGKVRRRIYRRTAASQLASYSWHLPKVILTELVGVLSHFVKSSGTKRES